MKRAGIVLFAFGIGCASRPEHPNPYVPPQTQYSTASTLLAAGGLVSMAAGATLSQDPAASKTVQKAGNAAMAAGLGSIAFSLFDVFEVRKEREVFFNLTRAFYRDYFGGTFQEAVERDAPPPIPEVPFKFTDPDAADDP